MIDPRQIRKADAQQLKLHPNEMARLAQRVQDDYRNAIADHTARMQRFTRYYRRWRNMTDVPLAGEEGNPNMRIPLIQWQTYSKWAKEHGALFGDDADIQAKPVGPSDQRRSRMVSLFITWAAFNHIKIQNPAAVFDFRKILNGRSHAFSDWNRETYRVPLIGGETAVEVAFEGPRFDPLWPDDFIVPGEDVTNLHQFSFVLRKYRATPEDLLQGEEEGRYQGIEEDWEKICGFASNKRQRDYENENVKREKDLAEGVIYEYNQSAANVLVVHEWYGKWHMPKGRRDVALGNIGGRERHETELVVRYIPEMHRVVGVQRLDEMYPRLQHRRPFVETSLVKDGSYWCPGFGEILESLEDELSVNSQLFTKAGQFSVGPVIFYKPASGFDPSTFSYEPGQSVACEDPNGVKVVTMQSDLSYSQVREQSLLSISERCTGQTDMSMGRAIDRPNAPRTARQTMALLGEGDVRASLEMTALREDWGEILHHFFQLYQEYAPEKLWFRVTEQSAGGLFDVKNGGAYMRADELNGRYDFELKFATSKESKEAEKQDRLALYQIDLQNPLIASNPRALWVLLDKVHKAFGDDHFGDLIPEPPDLGLPKSPREEWAMLLQGEEIHVNPLDNDQLHLMDHNKRIQDAQADPDRDEDAYRGLVLHAMEHMQQAQTKKLMQSMVASLAQQLAPGVGAGSGGLRQSQGPVELGDLHAQIGNMLMGGQEQPGQAPPAQMKPAA